MMHLQAKMQFAHKDGLYSEYLCVLFYNTSFFILKLWFQIDLKHGVVILILLHSNSL